MISERQDGKTEPASPATGWDFIVGSFDGTDQLRNDRQNRYVSFPCSSRGDEAQTEIGKQKAEMSQSLLTSAATRGASAPAGDGSVSLPVHVRATTRGGTPLVGTSRCDVRRPERAAGRRVGRRRVGKMKAVWSADVPGFRRLTLRSATGTAQRAIPTGRDIGLTAVAPKRRYVAARRRKVRPISNHGNGNENIGKRHANQRCNERQPISIAAVCGLSIHILC